jgi:hypothetical protein
MDAPAALMKRKVYYTIFPQLYAALYALLFMQNAIES